MPVATAAKPKKLSPAGYAAITDLKSRKKKLYLEACKLANVEGGMSAEQRTNYEKYEADILDLDTRAQKLEAMDPGEDDPDEDEQRRRQQDKPKPPARGGDSAPVFEQRAGEDDEMFAHRNRRATADYAKSAMNWLLQRGRALGDELRNLQADVDYAGGALVMPEQLYKRTIKAVDNILWIRQLATVEYAPNAASLGFPTLDSNPDDGEWTSEIGSITEDAGMKYGKRALVPTPIRKRVKVSNMWLRKAMEAPFLSNDDANGQGRTGRDQVSNRMAYAIANTEDKGFWTGSGTGQPLGMFTASTRGIPTSRDVVAGSTTAFTYLGLINTKYSLKVQYYPTATWCFNKTGMSSLMKIVDSNGRPILNFSTIPNQPDSLLGSPIKLSENIPGVFTTGLYVGLYGDLSYYMIADSLRFTLAVADQLYLETDQTGFFVGAEVDGMPILAEAFARMKLA